MRRETSELLLGRDVQLVAELTWRTRERRWDLGLGSGAWSKEGQDPSWAVGVTGPYRGATPGAGSGCHRRGVRQGRTPSGNPRNQSHRNHSHAPSPRTPRPQTGYAMWSWSCRERGPDSPRSSVPHCEMPILLGGTWDRALLLWPRNWQAKMNSLWGDLGSR